MLRGKALLASIVLILAACSDDGYRSLAPADPAGQAPVPVILTINATKGQTTRGLSPDGNTIKPVWSESDRVTVLSAGGGVIGTMTPTSYGSSTTTLKATINSPVSRGDPLNLVFPRTGRDYTGQKGTLADIAANYDYATAQVVVQYADDKIVSTTDAHFKNEQAIVRFNLTDKKSQPVNASDLTITAEGLLQNATTTGPLTITPAAATNEIYAALSGLSGVVTLTATIDSKPYTIVTPEPQKFEDCGYYRVTCQIQGTPVAYPEPLTFECYDRLGCAVSVRDYGDLEYKKNDGQWTTYKSQVNLNNGDKVSFRGTNATQTSSSNYMRFYCNGTCYIYGNIMSLLSKDSYATMTELPYDYTFQNLFQDNKNITHADGKDLVLPATVLRKNCYYQMFSGCTNFNYIKCLATDIPANRGCTTNWLKGTPTKGTRTFVKAEGFEGWPAGDSGIPSGWTVLSE